MNKTEEKAKNEKKLDTKNKTETPQKKVLKKQKLPKGQEKMPPPLKTSILSELFFTNFNYLFNLGSSRALTKADLRPLPPLISAKNLEIKALKILEEAKKDPKQKEIVNISDLIYKMTYPKLKRAIILKLFENLFMILLSIIPKLYLPQVKKTKGHRDTKILIMSPILAICFTIIRGMFKEHSKKFVCQVGSMTGQTLRVLMFDKLSKSSMSFLKNADPSLITNLLLFEFPSIASYVGKIPDLLSFPILFTFSCSAMVYFVGPTTLVTFVIFIIAWGLLVLITKKHSQEHLKEKYFAGMRTNLVNEFLKKMKQVKSCSFESYYENMIDQMRLQEAQAINSEAYFSSIGNFVMSLTPLFSILLILVLEIQLFHKTLDVTTTFTIVSIIAGLNRPLRKFVLILDRYYNYKKSLKSVNKFLFAVAEKHFDVEQDERLELGEILIENCSTKIESDEVSRLALTAIFGEDIDTKAELNQLKMLIRLKMKLKNGIRNSIQELEENQFEKNSEESKGKETKQNFNTLKTMMGGDFVNNIKDNLNIPKVLKVNNLVKKIDMVKILEGKWGDKTEKIHTIKDLRYEQKIKMKSLNKDITLNIHPQEKICFVGEDDSGVNTLFLSLLNETHISNGSINVNGDIVFLDCDKPCFLVGKTLRDNILMGEYMDKERYDRIVRHSELNFKLFKGGDMTQVIDQGSNFSSSQRMRILLARMLYQQGDIYLMKGFFGHEEDEIEQNLYFKLMEGPLKYKTVVIACNNEAILKLVDKIYIFFEGRANEIGTFDQLIHLKKSSLPVDGKAKKSSRRIGYDKRLDDFKQNLIKNLVQIEEAHQKKLEKLRFIKKKTSIDTFGKRPKKRYSTTMIGGLSKKKLSKLRTSIRRMSQGKRIFTVALSSFISTKRNMEAGRMVEKWNEDDVYHNLMKTMITYIFIKGKMRIIFLLFLFLMSTSLFILIDIWTGCWSNKLFKITMTKYMLIYLCISFSASFFVLIRDYCFTKKLTLNSNSLHKQLMDCLLNLSYEFYSRFPSCDIDFKLSSDIKKIDDIVNTRLHTLFESLAYCLGGMLILNYVYIGSMFVVTILLGFYLRYVFVSFVKTTTKMVQFISENTSHMQECAKISIEEMLHYRTQGKVFLLKESYYKATDEMQRAMSHLGFFSKRWLGMRMMISESALIAVAYLIPNFIIFYLGEAFSKSLLQFALAISWSLKIVGHFNLVVSSVFSIFAQIVSFGRLEHFLERVQIEEIGHPSLDKVKRLNTDKGIVMKEVNLTLANIKRVNRLTFSIQKEDSVALLGDSGSGKHLIFLLLLQIFEIDDEVEDEGKKFTPESKIVISGYDLRKTNSRDLRQIMSYLDKEAVTFSGTVRDNIDPDFKFKDKQIIEILEDLNSFTMVNDWVNSKKKKNMKKKKWNRETNLKTLKSKGFTSTDVKSSKVREISYPNRQTRRHHSALIES